MHRAVILSSMNQQRHMAATSLLSKRSVIFSSRMIGGRMDRNYLFPLPPPKCEGGSCDILGNDCRGTCDPTANVVM
ncbi:hypothetical protein CEXT_807371 [Caerostris extrusa]|uniref:Uncharacterized protein n=1 Tax=Caerostris extrusa TaxID=172846 RepID=A0AAV4MZF9_CAEEX|nr:hypothetical protein CEXT_807371 [Caerostris extrusa]